MAMRDWPDNVDKNDRKRTDKSNWGFMTTCPDCGKKRYVSAVNINVRVNRGKVVGLCIPCANKRRCGSGNYNWKGGRRIGASGYVWLNVPDDSPYAAMRNSMRQIAEHRLVMATHLGRCLTSDEQVHHINGIKTDNSIENLELTTRRAHSKVFVVCPCCGYTAGKKLVKVEPDVLHLSAMAC